MVVTYWTYFDWTTMEHWGSRIQMPQIFLEHILYARH